MSLNFYSCRRKSFKNSNPPATIAMSENACYSSEKSEVRVNLKDDSKMCRMQFMKKSILRKMMIKICFSNGY